MHVTSQPSAPPPVVCSACGVENAPDTVFCTNCHKALGDFKYVLEELQAEARWYEVLATKVATFMGQPHFILAHLIWFALWVAVNAGIIAIVGRFDDYPFQLLGIILAVEAIIMTGFLLINDVRENARSNKLAELDYEVNVRTYREMKQLTTTLQMVLKRLDSLEANTHKDG